MPVVRGRSVSAGVTTVLKLLPGLYPVVAVHFCVAWKLLEMDVFRCQNAVASPGKP